MAVLRVGPSEGVVCFEGFELDVRTGELRNPNGKILRLSEQPLRILIALLEHSGELVLREDLRKRLWPNDTVVEFEHSISAAMNRLRQALGDSAENPKFIETLARRGYRWKTPVEWKQPPSNPVPTKLSDGNLIGKRVSHYRVLEILGGGGMGVVYAAEDIKLGRRVALKFLPEELATDPAAMQRFEREARAASALNHPNICTIHAVEEHGGQPFIVMELLEGQTLREMISATESATLGTKGGFQLNAFLDASLQIASGLSAAHEKGIIHRDIKPANIFVTNRGQVKILDFGLAKLHEFEQADSVSGGSAEPTHQREWNPLLTLTRTGVTVGTAAYMAPEQVRGEDIDARTDLFSFGLVLYEMAARQRAFSGDTAPILHNAILNDTPTPLRVVNPAIPPKLENIIARAMEKDRRARYQSVSELRADLESLKTIPVWRHFTWKWALAGGLVLMMFIAAIFWFSRTGSTSGELPPLLKQKQLTTNSFEDAVRSGAISPDGKYLAYSTGKQIYIKLVETGETQAVLKPAMSSQGLYWEVGQWLPDSARFIVNSYPSSGGGYTDEGGSIWIVSGQGEPPRKLHENAIAYSVTRDGTAIAFGANKGKFGTREIWLMNPDGENVRKFYDAEENSAICCVSWSPDGQRILYIRSDSSGDTFLVRDLKGGKSVPFFSPSDTKNVRELSWLPDGRLIFSLNEPDSSWDTCNFWTMRLDPRSGQPVEKKRLSDWSGSCVNAISTTADGKRLVFLKWTSQVTSYLAELNARGNGILNQRRFPLSEAREAVSGWSVDSKAVIFISDRSGHFGLYRQAVDSETATLLLNELTRNARTTPDGKWILYFGKGNTDAPPARQPEPVMRLPSTGGVPQQLFIGAAWSEITCPLFAPALCAIVEPSADRKQAIITAIDPLKGRGAELGRFDVDPEQENWDTALSPDGSRLAAIRNPDGPIYILSLHGGQTREVKVKGWTQMLSVNWAADGRGLFVSSGVKRGRVLLHVDLQGNAHPLWENTGATNETLAYPSPDGRHLAMHGWTVNGNLWMLEDF